MNPNNSESTQMILSSPNGAPLTHQHLFMYDARRSTLPNSADAKESTFVVQCRPLSLFSVVLFSDQSRQIRARLNLSNTVEAESSQPTLKQEGQCLDVEKQSEKKTPSGRLSSRSDSIFKSLPVW